MNHLDRNPRVKAFCSASARHNHHENSCRKSRKGCRVSCVSRLLGGDSSGGRRLDRVGVDGGVLLGGGVGGGGLLVLLHLVVILEVTIILLIILVVGSGVLLSSLREVDDLAASTVGDDVV